MHQCIGGKDYRCDNLKPICNTHLIWSTNLFPGGRTKPGHGEGGGDDGREGEGGGRGEEGVALGEERGDEQWDRAEACPAGKGKMELEEALEEEEVELVRWWRKEPWQEVMMQVAAAAGVSIISIN